MIRYFNIVGRSRQRCFCTKESLMRLKPTNIDYWVCLSWTHLGLTCPGTFLGTETQNWSEINSFCTKCTRWRKLTTCFPIRLWCLFSHYSLLTSRFWRYERFDIGVLVLLWPLVYFSVMRVGGVVNSIMRRERGDHTTVPSKFPLRPGSCDPSSLVQWG